MTAVLAGSLYATLHTAYRARASAVSVVERARRGEAAFERTRADLASAVVPRGILAGVFLGEDGLDGLGRPADVLMFYTTTCGPTFPEGAADILMVEYACEPVEEGGKPVLLRRVTRSLLATATPEPEEGVLCRDVLGLDLKYFDGMDWQDVWDSSAQDNVLPRAVEVTLLLADEQSPGGVREINRIYPLPCSSLQPGLTVEASGR